MYDTHAHLQFKDFDQDRDIIIKESKEQGLKGIINIGIDYKTSLEALRLAKKYKDFCFAAVGIHPINVHKDGFDKLEFLKLAKMPEVVAIGEIGLDYYHSDKYKIGLFNIIGPTGESRKPDLEMFVDSLTNHVS